MLEPFFYPVHTYFAIRGNFEAMRRKKGWGKADRSGFDKKKKAERKPTLRQSANIGRTERPDLTI